jgi:chromate reductase
MHQTMTLLAPALAELQGLLQAADGQIIASPEYAHGISGVMKNTLQWLVSGAAFINVPIMLVNTCPRASHARAALREVVTTMSGNIIDSACVAVPLLGTDLDAPGILAQPQLATALTTVPHHKLAMAHGRPSTGG